MGDGRVVLGAPEDDDGVFRHASSSPTAEASGSVTGMNGST
ncbi:MAG: hypothetical protein AVDCRST_MAG19-3746 [uncultured Thermomicrobiales bacterium]|uniref:Uncharacterized protein n=1 Tax=uncultured Thermomicrobiales bacterium TaxID=1645740 RepID=A0A6J4VNI7_9BACT|nr:MAG: hypothetical protein AVDCRST_MAG19-3746 [uncultured Thermomicrobiales bacterium]